ncbi:gamma-glutamyl-gamma-aminobutyrate hydrolase family protein [Streptomyces sp. NBC_01485]|uniref:gamma-glutamyl-gamma-aminobutyrate hydrolase family protein n=1 Tax=Streptomyces sp. NBC_01485 TaxID=2903884 RepID=UPI002E348918|nr:gamma-glutamyl-gamma-aminobutyrate hydrolase family protein [Streptomyces sp. NBC_01485]
MTLLTSEHEPGDPARNQADEVTSEAGPPWTPLVGVTGRRYAGPTLFPQYPELWEGAFVDVCVQMYAKQIAAAGGMTVFLPRDSSAEALVQRLDAVVLSGGADVDPRFYGGRVTEDTTPLDAEQDEFDLAVARAAIARGIPVLGTCRGHEVLNVALGGTLYDHHLPGHERRDQPAGLPAHRVNFVEGTTLCALYGEQAQVNSIHHMAVDVVAPGLRVAARSDDGLVEAVEAVEADVLGVQWHPEAHAAPDPAFRWLVDTARARAAASHELSGTR